MADNALSFDGIQNYVNIGKLGNLGANAASSIFIKFDIQTTQSTIFTWGAFDNALTSIYIEFNRDWNENTSNHDICVFYEGANNAFLGGGTQSNLTANFNDGNRHTITITINPMANNLSMTIDGMNQSIRMKRADGNYTYGNLAQNFFIGAQNINGSPAGYFNGTVDNFYIGNGSALTNVFGYYPFNEGSGTTTADYSGNGNVGTLIGTPAPAWVNGITSTPDQSIYASYSQNPGVYKYVHLGTIGGMAFLQSSPALFGYLEFNSLALGTIVAYDSIGTSGNVIGSIAVNSIPGSTPVIDSMFNSLALKNGLSLLNTGQNDLTVASLP